MPPPATNARPVPTSLKVSPPALATPRVPWCPYSSSPNGVQRSYLRRENCAPKRKLYSRVVTLNVQDGGPQKVWPGGNGAGTAPGILEVPKYWPPSTTNPSQLVAFRAREASQPGSPAQCPALKRPASAYDPPANSSKRGNWTGGAGLAVRVCVGIGTVSGAGAGAGACFGAGAGAGA